MSQISRCSPLGRSGGDRDGDVLTVTKLDRIARSVRDLMEIVHRIEEKGAGLHEPGHDHADRKALLQVLGAVAESE
jgi:DNA invertase Pin-like site-specific DNA recombinase